MLEYFCHNKLCLKSLLTQGGNTCTYHIEIHLWFVPKLYISFRESKLTIKDRVYTLLCYDQNPNRLFSLLHPYWLLEENIDPN